MSGLEDLIRDVVKKDVVAREIANAGVINEKFKKGTKAFNGEFSGPGAIDTIYQDHGTGVNLMSTNDVTWANRPYGQFYTLDPSNARTNQTFSQLVYSNKLDCDAIEESADLNIFSAYSQILYPTSNHTPGDPHVWSIYVEAVQAGDFQIRVTEYPDSAGLPNLTSGVTLATSPQTTLPLGGVGRLALAFTPTQPWVVLGVSCRRTTGAASGIVQATGRWAEPLLEEVVLGQTAPSKFVVPVLDRGDIAANLLEGEALLGYISGLEISRTGANQITVAAGRAYIPGLGRICNLASSTTQSVSTNNGVYYVYLYESTAGIPNIEVSQTAPAVPYTGTARTKSGDTSRRFLGSVIVYFTALAPFRREADYFYFTDNVANRVVLNGGSATSAADIDLSTFVPAHARTVEVVLRAVCEPAPGTGGGPGTGTGFTAFLSYPNSGVLPGLGESLMNLTATPYSARTRIRGAIRCDPFQVITYALSLVGSGNTAFVDLMGFFEQR